jgi:DNA-binding response OmpR family regulator
MVQLRIVIVESRAEYAEKLEYFISREKGYTVAARFESAQSLLDAAREMAARKAGEWDLILMSLSLPDSAGWGTTQQLRALLPEVPIISYTVLESAENFLRGIVPSS